MYIFIIHHNTNKALMVLQKRFIMLIGKVFIDAEARVAPMLLDLRVFT